MDQPAPVTDQRRAVARGIAVLVAALLLSALVTAFGPALIDRLLAGLALRSEAMRETLFTFFLFGALILVAVAGGKATGVAVFAAGARPVRALGLGLLAGGLGIGAAVAITGVAGTLTRGPPPRTAAGMLLWGVAVVLLQTASEEIYFRGWLQRALVRDWGAAPAIIASSIAFAAIHLFGDPRSLVSLVNLLLGGLLFGLFAVRDGGLAAAIGAHFGWNGCEQLLYGLDPNPGLGNFGALTNLDLVGSALWGGSQEGLNASLAMTVPLLAIVAVLIVAPRQRPPSEADNAAFSDAAPVLK